MPQNYAKFLLFYIEGVTLPRLKPPCYSLRSYRSELSPDVDIIQGRPEDTSYSGNVLHLTNNYSRAISYAMSNGCRDFDDDMVIASYDIKILSQYGYFSPDIVDFDKKDPLQSLQETNQIRFIMKFPQNRLLALLSVNELPLPTPKGVVSSLTEHPHESYRVKSSRGTYLISFKNGKMFWSAKILWIL